MANASSGCLERAWVGSDIKMVGVPRCHALRGSFPMTLNIMGIIEEPDDPQSARKANPSGLLPVTCFGEFRAADRGGAVNLNSSGRYCGNALLGTRRV
jgi:hypothetical protein